MTDGVLRQQRDATLALLDQLIRKGREWLTRATDDSYRQAEVRIWQADCAAVINELSGGSKAHWLSRAYSGALLVRATGGDALVEADVTEIVFRILDVLEQGRRAVAGMDVAAVSAADEQQPHRFDFVHDPAIRPVLERAYGDSRDAFEHGDFERALMTSCGIIEAIITDALRRARPEPFDSPLILSLSKDERLAQDVLVEGRARPGQAPAERHDRPIVMWSFNERIAAAEAAGLIRGGCARLPPIARGYRDAARPAAVSERDAKLAQQVLHVVMRDLDPGR